MNDAEFWRHIENVNPRSDSSFTPEQIMNLLEIWGPILQNLREQHIEIIESLNLATNASHRGSKPEMVEHVLDAVCMYCSYICEKQDEITGTLEILIDAKSNGDK